MKLAIAFLLTVAFISCSEQSESDVALKEPLLDGLGTHQRVVTKQSPLAQ